MCLRTGQIVYDPGDVVDWLIFPRDCIVANLYVSPEGTSVQTCLIGYDGVVGVEALLGRRRSVYRIVTQSGGLALRIPVGIAMIEFHRDSRFRSVMDWYTQTMISQISQNAACNRLHSVEQQLCRLLLWSDSKTGLNELLITHELASSMLGVRREAISHAAVGLKREGAISYIRGNVKVLDRKALQRKACECYGIIEAQSRAFSARLSLGNRP